MRIGVLALQGDFDAHGRALERVGAQAARVRRASELDELDGLILPGGESTTISKGMTRLGLYEPIAAFARSGRPILGTCAGAILLASRVEGRPVPTLELMDLTAVRNAYGTQVDSFVGEAEAGLRCVFIRAPRLERLGPQVETLATVEGEPVWVRQGTHLATTFHPELTDDPRVHELLLTLARGGASGARRVAGAAT